ncbi:MAG: hypothetical protein RBU29_05240 [bacterium]|jgi:hypothetical protein|nr:hypothetical protein [bacterium]
MLLSPSICAFGHSLLWRIPVTILLTLFFTLFADRFLPYSGDGGWIADEIISGGKIVMHSPLSSLIQTTFYTLLHPWGFTAWQAISVSSAFAGALVIQVFWQIRKRPLFLLINIGSGSFLVFAGLVENYAWVNLFLVLMFWAAEKFYLGKWPLWPAMTFFFLAALSHFLAFFYFPALVWLIFQNKKFSPAEFAIPLFVYLAIHIALNLFIPGEGISFDFSRLVPWFEKTSKLHHFTFFTWDHAYIKFYFHLKSSFPIWPFWWPEVLPYGVMFIPLEWPLLFLLRKQIDSPFKKCLFLSSLTGLIWTTLWHPDLGPIDWDLFSQMGIPLHLLLGLLLLDILDSRR